MENLYKILNCSETASFQELKKSYQSLALKHHPDKARAYHGSKRCQEKFVKLNHAWTILRDPKLREQYDVKWKERCLSQTYPIQDIVDFEEFEKMEAHDSAMGDGELGSERTEKDVVTGECCTNEGDTCGEAVDNEKIQKESYEKMKNDKVSEGVMETLEKVETGFITQEKEYEMVDDAELPPFIEDNICYTYDCRCGGNYVLTDVDVKLKFDIVCCDTCSLSIKVIYNDDDDDDNDGGGEGGGFKLGVEKSSKS